MTDMMLQMGRQDKRPPYTMPLVVRAREYHLYDRDGRRFVDFFQNHGRAILGHRPEGMVRAIKGTASRGLVAEYPSVYLGRLEKLVKQLLPGYHVARFYNGLRYVVEVLQQANGAPLIIADPAVNPIMSNQRVAFWRPFLTDVEVTADVLIPILPFPGNFVCELVCVKDVTIAKQLPPSDAISPMVLDLLIKATGALLGLTEEQRRQFSRKTALHACMVHTCGPYCSSGLEGGVYEEFHTAALAAGIVIPPLPEAPIIIPPVLSDGEMVSFLRVIEEFRKE